jgi:hypothetical protein
MFVLDAVEETLVSSFLIMKGILSIKKIRIFKKKHTFRGALIVECERAVLLVAQLFFFI